MLKISVIVPIFNTEKYLKECVDSVLNQAFTNVELILVNDGSTDGSLAICEQYARQDKRIAVVNQENKGLSGARNSGVNVATGDYVFFLDSDDYILPGTLFDLHKILTENTPEIDILLFNFISEKGINSPLPKPLGYISKEKALYNIYENTAFVTACTKLYKKSVFDKVSFQEGLLHEDEMFCHKAFFIAENIYSVDKVFYHYRVVDGSITNRPITVKSLDVFYAYESRVKLYKENNFNEALKLTYKFFFHIILSKYIAAKAANDAEKENLEKITGIIKKYKNEIADGNFCKKLIIAFAVANPRMTNRLYKFYNNIKYKAE